MKLVSSAVWLHPIELRYRKLAVRTLKGGFPRRERPWAAWSLPGGPGRGGSSRAPSAKTKKLTIRTIPNPQASARRQYHGAGVPQNKHRGFCYPQGPAAQLNEWRQSLFARARSSPPAGPCRAENRTAQNKKAATLPPFSGANATARFFPSHAFFFPASISAAKSS